MISRYCYVTEDIVMKLVDVVVIFFMIGAVGEEIYVTPIIGHFRRC